MGEEHTNGEEKVTEQKKRFECYLNIQVQDGSKSNGVIISGSGETIEETRSLFDHALKAYEENRE